MSGTPLLTLAGTHRHALEVKKSRFLAQAAPVASPEQALAFVQQAADASATHNAWAYRLGTSYRFHDDGEVGGTAGRPILQAIEGQGVDRVVVLVTRWYGGVKLGTGGLVRAYGGCAAECLRSATGVPLVVTARLAVDCDFADLALLRARLGELEAAVVDEQFHAAGAALTLELPETRVVEAQARIADLTRGRSEARRLP